MEYSILDSDGKVVAVANNAREAKTKLERGRCVFGDQTIRNETGAKISEAALNSLCEDEAAAEDVPA